MPTDSPESSTALFDPQENGMQAAEGDQGIAVSLTHIGRLTTTIDQRLGSAVREIQNINMQTRLLSFNAQLEATRAGTAGRAFEVVAKEMVSLSSLTAGAASRLDEETKTDIQQLSTLVDQVSLRVRGTRLSDLAFTNIDLIDRNLYERSCDVRWWATDSSCVDALLDPERNAGFASQRLGVILDAYTVYYDIVLCDLRGNVIANGRPREYACQGASQESTAWFRSAMATRSGNEFGFQGVHCSPSLANGQMVLAYSATVRRGGKADGEPLGCLGILFNWEALAQTIVERTQLGDAEIRHTRVCIVDGSGNVIADNRKRHLRDRLPLGEFAALMAAKKSFAIQRWNGTLNIVGYALSPGFETYATGWHSFIIQEVDIS